METYRATAVRRLSDGEQVVMGDNELLVLKRDYDALQAKVDELMLEYCPDEVTDEQWEEYCRHQRVVYDGRGFAWTGPCYRTVVDEAGRVISRTIQRTPDGPIEAISAGD